MELKGRVGRRVSPFTLRNPIAHLARLLVGAVLVIASTAAPVAAESFFTGPVEAGQLQAPPHLETSGLAASRRNPGLLWTHDDSGGAAALYAVKTTGEQVATLKIAGTKNRDWEDIAAYAADGKAWLLIADTGDNDGNRPNVEIHIVEEPVVVAAKAVAELSVRPTVSWRIRYEDGPRDCESVAVDPVERAIYLLSKREDVKRLYRIGMEAKPDASGFVVARFVGLAAKLPRPTAAQRGIRGYLGRKIAEPTAMDFSAEGTMAVVLTYGGLYLFPRHGTEPWNEVLGRAPIELPKHGLIQAEAACFSTDGRQIYVAAENWRPLLRYDRQ